MQIAVTPFNIKSWNPCSCKNCGKEIFVDFPFCGMDCRAEYIKKLKKLGFKVKNNGQEV